MQPSSLVFVAIVAVWALYVVRSLVGRRVLLAESRTADRFSSGLRVLSRRSRAASSRRSGESVLSSPRVVVDADGEFLYIPGTRRPAARKAQPPAMPAAPAVVSEPDAAAAAAARASVAPVAAPAPSVSPSPSTSAASTAPLAGARASASSAEDSAPSTSAARPGKPAKLGTLDIAVMASKIAARRRARIMAVLLVATISSWGIAFTVPAAPLWVALPASVLLVLHALASRAAGLRSRDHLTYLARELASDEVLRPAARPATRPVPAVVAPAVPAVPERVARRQAAVGAETWNPIPVPPPTYTLKPTAPRPEPAPLDLPAAAVSRAALPRTAADIERILSLDPSSDSDDEGYEDRKVVNG